VQEEISFSYEYWLCQDKKLTEENRLEIICTISNTFGH